MGQKIEKFKTYGSVFDEKTRLALRRLESKRVFDELLSPISVGKESNVFSALTCDNKIVCVKIYRLNTCDFKKMYTYISADRRFFGVQRRRRSVIFAWAQREYSNLKLAKKAGVFVPTPYAVHENVLVMEFLGKKGSTLKLKDSDFDSKKYGKLVIDNMKLLYQKAKLVHGDLSEFNMLEFNNKPYLIDLSHSAKIDYPNVEELLERDVRNVVRFFNSRGTNLNYETVLNEVKHG